MSRIINTENPGKIRNQEMRTCAEILRRLSTKPDLDREAKDMIAQLVFSLRVINDTIEHSAEVWENRDYWMKAEELRESWRWVNKMIGEIKHLVREDDWASFPIILAGLFQHVGHIKIKKFTRAADTWQGAYARLQEHLAES
ncbi:MAG: hypothetical protein GYB66_03810 [Chloroflexi bacterium]|nr:hypothetical protein [Chloroflexota bacterium]